MGVTPVCAASPYQIQNLLQDNKVQSADYNTIRTLVRGEVNSFYGFQFLITKMGQALTSVSNQTNLFTKTGAAFKRGDISNVAVGGTYTTNITFKPEKIVFSLPYMAFSNGEIPHAGYMHVRENWNIGGVWEFLYQTMVGYRRQQDEYVQIAYGAPSPEKGVEPRRTPSKLSDYYDNYKSDGSTWNFANAATAA